MTDANEILGYVHSCKNEAFLNDLGQACANRLAALAEAKAKAEQAAKDSDAALAAKQREFDKRVAEQVKAGEAPVSEPHSIPPQDRPKEPQTSNPAPPAPPTLTDQ